jgi:tRNA(fMet)-specific endonuclease VapC
VSLMVFVDTNVIIDFIAGDKHVASLLNGLAESEEVKTTTITEYELLKHKDKLKKQLAEDFLSEVTVYSFDREAAKKSALLYGKLKEAGKLINENDLLIAGIALANDDVLLTRDQKFGNINNPNIKVI